MQEGWEKPLWLSKLLGENKTEILAKLDSIENIFKKAGDATATDSDIVKPKTAYNGNVLLTGTLEDKTGTENHVATASVDATNSRLKMQVPATAKYGVGNYLYATYSTIASLIGLTASKLVKGNTILGITGNSNNMDTSGANATASDVLSGKIVGVKGSLITGDMISRKGTTVDATAVSSDDNYTYFTTPAGCYSDTSKVRTPNSNLGAKIYYLGTGNSFNVSDYPGYKNFTKDNFIIGTNSAFSNGVPYGPTGSAVIGGSIYTKQIGSCAYNNSDGILTINPYTLGIKVSSSEQTITLPMFAYLII